MEKVLVTGPITQPLTLAQAKAQLNIESAFTTDDDLINGDLRAAINIAELYMHRRLITQTWQVFFKGWPGSAEYAENMFSYSDGNDYITLPFGQLQSVTHIKYKDTDGAQTTWDSSNYIVQNDSRVGRIVLAYDKTWPTETLYPSLPIEIQFVCGWYHGDAWEADTVYSSGAVIVPTTFNGLAYECTTGGTSDSSEPTFGTTAGGTTSDNTAVWTCRAGIPIDIINAIKLYISDAYQIRENFIFGTIAKDLKISEGLLWQHKLFEV